MTVFLPYYVAGLVLLVLELRGVPMTVGVTVPRARPSVWVAALLVAYAVQLAVVRYAATKLVGAPAWRLKLPIPVAGGMVHADLVEAALLSLALFESFALFALFRSKPAPIVLAVGTAAMLLLSLAAPAFISPDPYAYVGDAMLGLRAYTPPPTNFAGEYAQINGFFQAPILPAPYGPLWIALARLFTAAAPALLSKLLAFRLFGALSFLALLGSLRAYGVPSRILAIAAVNPAIAQQYVADAHNDLLGIVLVVLAAALIRRNRTAIGSGLTIAAGLVKLPFTVLALPIFARIERRTLRYACCFSAIALAAAVSWVAGGSAYFHGLNVHVPAPGAVYVLNAVVSIAALFALGVATIRGRRLYSALWLIAMMSSYIATWYVAYGLPYALARHRLTAYLLVTLPFACAVVDAKFVRPWTPIVLAAAIAILILSRPQLHADRRARSE
jgi:hypothetical protein